MCVGSCQQLCLHSGTIRLVSRLLQKKKKKKLRMNGLLCIRSRWVLQIVTHVKNIWTRLSHFLILCGIEFVEFHVPSQLKLDSILYLTDNNYSAHNAKWMNMWVSEWMRMDWKSSDLIDQIMAENFLWWKCLCGSLFLIFWKGNIWCAFRSIFRDGYNIQFKNMLIFIK